MKKKFKWCLTGSTSLGVLHFRGVGVRCRPTSLGDKCLSCKTWWLCMVLSMWVLTFPRLGLLLQGSPFLALGPLLWTPYASLVDRGSKPSSADMLWSLLWLGRELCSTNPGSCVIDCRYCSRHDGWSSNWLAQFLLEWRLQYQTSVKMRFFQWEFLLSFCMPTGYLGVLLTIVHLPPQVEYWSSWVEIDLWLPPIRWLEGDLEMSSGCVSLILHRIL